MDTKPLFASTWYTDPPLHELRGEVHHIYDLIEALHQRTIGLIPNPTLPEEDLVEGEGE